MEGDSPPMTGEEIVISGISGVFPNSGSVKDFMDNLYNKVDMVSDEPRWSTRDPEIPQHVGKISEIDKFDAQFFKVGYQQCLVLEPISKKIMEHAYGAIFDSGNTHVTLRGKIIGVFTGASFADYTTLCLYDIKGNSDFIVGGSSKSMLANRISYWVDGKGTSYNLDFSCASSSAALEQAYKSMKAGEIDAAIVGSANLCTHPALTKNLQRYGLLCFDGKTKCFDKNADGYVRAEAANMMFLQKSKDAKRIYAEVYNVHGTYKLKPESPLLPTRQSDEIENFIQDVYCNIDIDPSYVEYIEANGAALPEADANELNAIAKLFAAKHDVKVGCVKSNMGNSEAVSGMCALTKLCIAYHKGQIPANLHYSNPQDLPAIKEGKVKVVTENTTFGRKFTALNNFSFTGANFHVVLKGHYKEKDLEKYESKIPRIVLASGRKESCITKIFENLKSKPIDAEEISLIHDIFSQDIVGHTGRGYTLLDVNKKGETVSISESIDYYPGLKRPLWFVYSGMGSQWAGMGADLMRIPTFASAIERCHKVLEPKGIDLVKIVTEIDNKIFDNILNAFVGIGAVQIGLTDILKDMGIIPDYIIGHSLGEMACAYHDDTMTAEELILSTYSRGIAVLNSNLKPGLMAAVGVGHKVLQRQCPPDIDIGCHNSSDSSTISGPIESMKKFIAELTKKGIFAKEVPSANIAYHSRYVADAGPELLRRLKEILKNPKPRSQKWISTSVPEENWDSVTAKYSSAEYHTNNLLNAVLFEEMGHLIPENAVIVEIAPHGLLQAILKRSHKECTHIPLTKRGNTDGVKFLLNAIGQLYLTGYNPRVSILYPKVEYPVSTETPLLSHLVEWEHSEDWPVLNTGLIEKFTSASRNMVISVHDDDFNYIQGYIVNGINIIPSSALLVFVWETLAMYNGVNYRDMSVIFKNIEFHSDVTVASETPTRITVMISKGKNQFEVNQDDKLIVSGTVGGARKFTFYHNIEDREFETDEILLNTNDVYTIFNNYGYQLSETFQSIHLTNLERNKALIKWSNDWITFLDGLIQLNVLSKDFKGTPKIKFISKLRISALEQENVNRISVKGINCYNAQVHTEFDVTRCGGVEFDKIMFFEEAHIEKEADVLMTRSFFSYNNMDKIDIKSAIEINLQIIEENSVAKHINITIINPKIAILTNEVVKQFPLIGFEINVVDLKDINMIKNQYNKTNVLVVENVLQNKEIIKAFQNLISDQTFVITIEDKIPKVQNEIIDNLTIITSMSNGDKIVVLMKKNIKKLFKDVICVPISTDNTFAWISRVKNEARTMKRVVIISERQPYCGLLGFVKKLKMGGHDNVSLFVIDDFHAPKFNVETNFFKDQLGKNLAVNVFKRGQWGGYYYTSSKNENKPRNMLLKIAEPGDVNNLTWMEIPKTPANKNLVQVCFTALSINDYKKAISTKNHENEFFGMDFSGLDKNGDRIMGIINGGSVAKTIEADSDLMWPVPDHWTLEDAATVPLPYLHAYYCLTMRAQIHRKSNVFVVGGAGPLGQAIISLCLANDCTVFTTVRNERKKKALLELYPALDENNICYSGDDSFYSMVMFGTKKKGCDVVISSMSGYFRKVAQNCVGKQGVFLDLNKLDMEDNKDFCMEFLNMDRSYRSVDFSNIFRPKFSNDKKILRKYLIEGINSGVVKPISRTIFSTTEVPRAFRFLSSSKHIGRVLIRIRDPKIKPEDLNVIPRIEYSDQDVVVIVCGESDVGFELADRLVQRGARKLILNTKTISGYLQTKFKSWGKQEVCIKVSTENLGKEEGCTTLMKNAMKFGKVKGIFVVFDSKYSDNEVREDFIDAFNKKCLVTIHLDAASRNCAELSHFVILSWLTRSSSDEYALSLVERLCDLRNEMGLRTLVLRFESLVKRDTNDTQKLNLDPESLSALFNTLERGLKQNLKNVLAFECNERKHIDFMKKMEEILDIKDLLQDVNDDILIQELNLNDYCYKELRNLINRTFQIDYPDEKIKNMSLRSLKQLTITNHYRNDHKVGLSAFISDVIDEETHIISQPLVQMPTLHTSNVDFNDQQLQTGDHLLMIPGFEGRCEVFQLIAERLKIPAYCVQLSSDVIGNSFEDIAVNVRKILRKQLKIGSRFYILGYSFGVNIALELAAILEKEGLSGVIYCLDSSPMALKQLLKSHIGNISDHELENNILYHISEIMSKTKDKILKEKLENSQTCTDKLEFCIKLLKEKVSYSKEYMKSVLETACKEIFLAKEYEPKLELKCQIILVKGNLTTTDIDEDYGLSKLTKGEVKVFNIPSNHSTAPSDCRVSNIVNKFIDPKVLEEFKKRNLCVTYSLNEE